MEKDAYNVKVVAKRLNVAEATVRRLIREGDIPSIRISPRRIIIPATAFEEWLNARAKRDA